MMATPSPETKVYKGISWFSQSEQTVQHPVAEKTHAYGSVEQHSGYAILAVFPGNKKKRCQPD